MEGSGDMTHLKAQRQYFAFCSLSQALFSLFIRTGTFVVSETGAFGRANCLSNFDPLLDCLDMPSGLSSLSRRLNGAQVPATPMGAHDGHDRWRGHTFSHCADWPDCCA